MFRSSFAGRSVSARYVVLVVVLAAALLIPAGFTRASGPDGTLKGTITDSVSAAAVSGAVVQVYASDVPWAFQATTDGSGLFVVSLPAHTYTIQVSAPAYYQNFTSVGIGSGQTVWLNMTLRPAAARSARVQGVVSDSVSSAPVTLGQIVATASGSPPIYTNASGMDATGYYQMDLVPGTYLVSTKGVIGYAVYTSSSQSLGAGVVKWFNISLTPNPLVAWINGTVEDANNYSHLVGATITASVGGLILPSTTSNASGGFSLHVPTGNVLVVVDALGYAPDSSSIYIFGSGTNYPYFFLTALSSEVRGIVTDGLTGRPLRGVLLAAHPIFSSGYSDQASTDATGAYDLHLAPDDYTVSVSLSGYTSWSAWAFLSRGQVAWSNVTLWPLVAQVKGYVIDGGTGSPLPGRSVQASDVRSGYGRNVISNATGFFSFVLPPSPAISVSVYGYAPYAGAIAYVSTRPYATIWVNLTLPRLNAQLRANVTDALTGLPISGASVSAYWTIGFNGALSNATGIALVDVPAGLALNVYASALGYVAWYGAIPRVTGTVGLAIALYPNLAQNVTIKGYVKAAGTNAALSSATVQVSGYGNLVVTDYTDGLGFYQLTTVTYAQTVRATQYGYAAGVASVNPAPAATIWLNFSLPLDSVSPVILSFTATPATNVQTSNPTLLQATVNESNVQATYLSVYMLASASAGVGTFVSAGNLAPASITVTPTTQGNESVSAPWDTRTPIAFLSDGGSAQWWPVSATGYPYQVAVTGYWQNATLSTAVYATATFDSRSGALLYVNAYPYGYIAPQDQPGSAFQPAAWGLQVNLATAAIVGYTSVRGNTYRLGNLAMMYANAVPTGTYAALLQVYDAAGHSAMAATLIHVAGDTVPPVARAGPDQTVNQGTRVTFDGSTSSDNVGVVNYTWTFTDGSPRVLYGATASYTFANPGTYVVTLTVRDADGNTNSDTLTVTVLDTSPPTLSITSPSEDARVSGSITVTATASDNVGVVRVAFRVDGVPAGNATAAPFQIALDTSIWANGNHTIEAIAYDAAGNSASTTRHVTVQNTPGGNGGSPIGSLDVMAWILVAILLAAVAAVVGVLLLRRRRPRTPMGPSPQP